jgi:hypothetical protein
MSEYTPGPWSVGHMEPRKYGAGITQYETPVHVGEAGNRGNCLAIVYLGGVGAITSTPEATMANARLIAAAPDLLAAAKLIVRRAVLIASGLNTDELEAAIAKALPASPPPPEKEP